MASAQAVVVRVASGFPGSPAPSQAAFSAARPASVSAPLVSPQSRPGGWRIASCRSIHAIVASPMSLRIIVLSQSNVATGLCAGS
jgi:hypothetical protein